MLDLFAQFAVTADTLPRFIFGAIVSPGFGAQTADLMVGNELNPNPNPLPPPQGRTVWRDIGTTAVFIRLMSKFLDFGFLASLMALTAHTTKDYKENDAADN